MIKADIVNKVAETLEGSERSSQMLFKLRERRRWVTCVCRKLDSAILMVKAAKDRS